MQVYRTISDYLAGRYPQLPYHFGRRIYPLVVKLEEWYLFGFELPARLETAIKEIFVRESLPINWLEEMPYSIVSVDELETAAGVINATGIRDFSSGKVKDPERRYWGYAAYCSDRHAEAVRGLPPLFDEEYNALFAELTTSS